MAEGWGRGNGDAWAVAGRVQVMRLPSTSVTQGVLGLGLYGAACNTGRDTPRAVTRGIGELDCKRVTETAAGVIMDLIDEGVCCIVRES